MRISPPGWASRAVNLALPNLERHVIERPHPRKFFQDRLHFEKNFLHVFPLCLARIKKPDSPDPLKRFMPIPIPVHKNFGGPFNDRRFRKGRSGGTRTPPSDSLAYSALI